MRRVNVIKNNFGRLFLYIFLIVIILLNIKPGAIILGNDNYSPELNPWLTVSRSLQNPAWRDYRVLGVPSDSEQADIFRATLFGIVEFILPVWLVSQLYVYATYAIGVISIAELSLLLFASAKLNALQKNILYIFSGLIYGTSLVAIWMLNSPLIVFLAAFGYLPFVLWRLLIFARRFTVSTFLLYIFSILLFTTSAMVPTTFIVVFGIICIFLVSFYKNFSLWWKKILLSIALLLLVQMIWIPSFITYVRSTSQALQDSYINRVLTPMLIEGERKYNAAFEVLRFAFSWLYEKNDNGSPVYAFSSWFLTNPFGKYVGFVPVFFASIGIIIGVKKRYYFLIPSILIFFMGWLFLLGDNPPFGTIFSLFQTHVPLFKQVFRWQSSKAYAMVLLPLSFLGGYGLCIIAEKIYQKLSGRAALLFTGGIAGLCIIYVYPWFLGHMISSHNEVQLPSEYWALRKYLEKTDPNGRVFVAPEANTLYFRATSFGFFGSSFFNYLIPNPVIEKALTTGSYENEQAQKILEQTYHARQFEAFSKALQLYNVSYILVDYASGGGNNGYAYDWDSLVKTITSIAGLQTVWNSGSLVLYKVPLSPSKYDAVTVVGTDHDWARLSYAQVIGALPMSIRTTTNNEVGALYPLSLSFDSMESDATSWVTRTIYHGAKSLFRFVRPELKNGDEVPLHIARNPDQNSIAVTYDNLSVSKDSNAETATSAIPWQSSAPIRFLSHNWDVIDLDKTPEATLLVPYPASPSSLLAWENTGFYSEYPIEHAKASSLFSAEGIAQLHVEYASENDTLMNVCAFSQFLRRCINAQHALQLQKGAASVEVGIHQKIAAGDTLDIYFAKANGSPGIPNGVTIRTFGITQFTKPQVVIGDTLLQNSYEQVVYLEPGDQLTTRIPKIQGEGYHLTSASNELPVLALGDCALPNRLQKNPSYAYSLETPQGCSDTISVPLGLIRTNANAPIYAYFFAGSNAGGIPQIASVRRNSGEFAYIEERFPYEKSGTQLRLTMLPQDLEFYTLSLYSYGVSRVPSRNTLTTLSLQKLPQQWFSLRLEPEEKVHDSRILVATNRTVHPYFIMPKDTKSTPVRINGWEQGFLTDIPVSDAAVVYWPNYLAWGGAVLCIVGCAAIGSIVIVRRRRGQTARHVSRVNV